jgi:hypothetical protein
MQKIVIVDRTSMIDMTEPVTLSMNGFSLLGSGTLMLLKPSAMFCQNVEKCITCVLIKSFPRRTA